MEGRYGDADMRRKKRVEEGGVMGLEGGDSWRGRKCEGQSGHRVCACVRVVRACVCACACVRRVRASLLNLPHAPEGEGGAHGGRFEGTHFLAGDGKPGEAHAHRTHRNHHERVNLREQQEA